MSDILEPVEANALYLLAKYKKTVTPSINRQLRDVIKTTFALDVLSALDEQSASDTAHRHAVALLTR